MWQSSAVSTSLLAHTHFLHIFCSGVGVFRRRGLWRQQHHVGGRLGDSLHLQPGLVPQQPSGAPVALPLRQLLLLLHVLLRLPVTHPVLLLLLPVSSVPALQPGPSQHRVAVGLRPHLSGARASQRVQRSVVTRMRPGERWDDQVFLDRLPCRETFDWAEAISRLIDREILKRQIIINNIFDHLFLFLKSVAVTRFFKYDLIWLSILNITKHFSLAPAALLLLVRSTDRWFYALTGVISVFKFFFKGSVSKKNGFLSLIPNKNIDTLSFLSSGS